MEPRSQPGSRPEPQDADGVGDMQAALLHDGALQFTLPMRAPEPPVEPWHLNAGFGGVEAVWILVALGVALAVGLAVAYLRDRPAAEDASSPPAAGTAGPDAPAVAPAAARLALGDADRLAAEGRFLDAARALLGCGLDAIAEHHPGLLRPTTTSRDLAREAALPEPLRVGFGRIARAVEKGLFGGRAVEAGDYAECRRAFLDAAFAPGRAGTPGRAGAAEAVA